MGYIGTIFAAVTQYLRYASLPPQPWGDTEVP
jgi:hypothetical protein